MDKTCEYTQHEYNIASTSCGESTVLFDLWRFCPWCGKKILVIKDINETQTQAQAQATRVEHKSCMKFWIEADSGEQID